MNMNDELRSQLTEALEGELWSEDEVKKAIHRVDNTANGEITDDEVEELVSYFGLGHLAGSNCSC